MTNQASEPGKHQNSHDDPELWRTASFVEQWVDKDDLRPNDRLDPMRAALAAMPYAKGESIQALDIGAGHGLFASEVLRAFPNAVVTLQDVSEPMFDIARQRLANSLGQLRFVHSDLSTAEWTSALGGPFDLAVSSIAIHNLYDLGLIAGVYRGVYAVLKPGGTFINLDHLRRVGGADGHVAWLREAGFTEVSCVTITERLERLSARKAS